MMKIVMVAALLIGSGVQVQAGTITLFDGTFNDADWDLQTDGSFRGGGSGAQFPLGGNPGTFRRNRNTSSSDFGNKLANSWNFFTSTPYVPSVSGAIDSLDYSEESLSITGAQSATVALRQDGFLFRHIPTFSTTASTTQWQPHAFEDLSDSDFALYFFDALANQWVFVETANPNFSSTGSAIEFGYFRSNSASFGGVIDVSSGIDNWSVTLHTEAIPEPSTALLILFGFAAASGFRSRRFSAC